VTTPVIQRYRARRTWDEAASEFILWVQGNDGKLPTSHGDETERKHYAWMHAMRNASKGGTATSRWDPEYGVLLSEFVPNWNIGTTPGRDTLSRRTKATFEQRALELAEWFAVNGRLPKYNDPEERNLYVFLNNSRSAARGTGTGTWTPERQAILDAALPGWR
jgi:hypothetical protein